MNTKNLLSELGGTLVDNGYDLVLIRAGQKRPLMDDWTTLNINREDVTQWAESHPRANIGIQTRHTPAIDIDVYDDVVAAEMEAWVLDNISDRALIRVGQAPKRLLLFRTDAPFTKLKQKLWDDNGREHAVEILCDGQQFVAFGIHPDTKRSFEWMSLENPVDLAVDDLPLLTQEDALSVIEAFIEIGKRRGWRDAKGARSNTHSRSSDDDFGEGDDLLSVSQTVDDYDEADVRDALTLVDGAEDYDHWLQVGMALHHQFDGDETGLELWDEWSQQAHNYDSEAMRVKWDSFAAMRSRGKVTTLRYIIKCAKEAAKQRTKDDFERIKNVISSCTDVDELFSGIVTEVKNLGLQPHQIEKVATLIQKRALAIDEVKLPITKVRDAITKAPSRRSANDKDIPEWVSSFVWLEGEDCFYSLTERKELTIRSYNARYDRLMLTAEDKALGRAIPDQRAADTALTHYGMPHVDGRIYLPGCDQLVEVDGSLHVNIYDDRDVPLMKRAKTNEEHAALRAVQNHFAVLFPDERERSLILSFLAYHVQQPAERVNWAVLIQGVEGAGKTWIQNLMASVLGRKNVGPVKPASLFSEFNGWAEGKKMIFVEEIRLRGHDRFEVLDKIKDNITNDVLSITRKGRDPYDSPNVTSYVMFTNYADALSLSDNDRRYLIVSTSFQSEMQINRHLSKYPNYFIELFDTVADHGGVLRDWLMSYELSEEFVPRGRAPMTLDKVHMRDINMSEEHEAIYDLIEAAPRLDCSNYLLSTTTLTELLIEHESNVGVPKTSAMRAILEQMGFRFLGRVKAEGKMQRFYTHRPDLFPTKSPADIADRVRRILAGEEPELL